MYFLWKRSQNGCLKLSGEGFRHFVNSTLEGIPRCRSFSILEKNGPCGVLPVGVFVFVNVFRNAEERQKVEERLRAHLAPLGLPADIVWTDEGLASEELNRSLLGTLRSPTFWGALFALFTVAIYVGTRGLFWVLFAGTAGWFIAKGLFSPRLQEWFVALFPRFGRNH